MTKAVEQYLGMTPARRWLFRRQIFAMLRLAWIMAPSGLYRDKVSLDIAEAKISFLYKELAIANAQLKLKKGSSNV